MIKCISAIKKRKEKKLLKTKQEFFGSYFVMRVITIVKFSGDMMAEQLTTPTLNLQVWLQALPHCVADCQTRNFAPLCPSSPWCMDGVLVRMLGANCNGFIYSHHTNKQKQWQGPRNKERLQSMCTLRNDRLIYNCMSTAKPLNCPEKA